MIQSRRPPFALLTACMVLAVIALIGPIAGQMTGQKGMMGQGNMSGRVIQCEGKDCESIMANCPADKICTIMPPMMSTCPKGMTCYIIEQYENISDARTRLECAQFWLEKAMELQDMHIRDPSTATDDSQIELRDRITRAYECVAGKNTISTNKPDTIAG
jgi:hypothetical protein